MLNDKVYKDAMADPKATPEVRQKLYNWLLSNKASGDEELSNN